MSELKSVTYKLIGGKYSGEYVTCFSEAESVDYLCTSDRYTRRNYFIFGIEFKFMVHDGMSDEWFTKIVSTEISAALEHIGGARVSQ